MIGKAREDGFLFDPRRLKTRQMIALEAAPAVLVLTRSSNFGYIHQSLNLGAHFFIAKDRLFSIPGRLCGSVEDEEKRATHRANSYLAGLERTGHRSNFRSLYALRPDRKAALQRNGRADLVTGDEGDREFIAKLPKADLHCHLGTTIRLETIQALACNTVGRMIADHHDGDEDGGHVNEVICRVLEIVIMTGALRSWADGDAPVQRAIQALPESQLLFAVGKFVIGHTKNEQCGQEKPKDLKSFFMTSDRPLDELTVMLAPITSPIRVRWATALVVVALWLLGLISSKQTTLQATNEIAGRWSYLLKVAEWRSALALRRGKAEQCQEPGRTLPHGERPDEQIWIDEFIDLAARECQRQAQNTDAARPRHSGDDGQRTPGADGLYPGGTYFHHLHSIVVGRIQGALQGLESKINEAITNVVGYFDKDKDLKELLKAATSGPSGAIDAISAIKATFQDIPTLQDVVIPKAKSDRSLNGVSLMRYLWGCGLLGAEHLQYPENLLLAAHDIVQQHVDDCIIYAEVRCETPGFTSAGMSPMGATDVLRAGFDLASAFYHCTGGKALEADKNGTVITNSRRKPFVRVNLLLAAKRHKTPAECAAVVSLLETYLSGSPRRIECNDPTVIPAWWKPCAVVGFDLSGNEAVSQEKIEPEVRRLFKYNSPITIHAGEAATADRVWEAVYMLHARRIGHGLRLRENPRLLRYCIDEGICMEMCPISNSLTHGFAEIIRSSKSAEGTSDYDGSKLEHYPLRFYMAAGLEVCLNTDNRALHHEGTLTDEYLRAARLSGGFSRWEVLKLARAGFKHAFLPKVEIADLLSAVENRVHPMTAHQEGLDWWSTR